MECGHPEDCVISSDEGTSYCAWCEETANSKNVTGVQIEVRPTQVAEIIADSLLRNRDFWRGVTQAVSDILVDETNKHMRIRLNAHHERIEERIANVEKSMIGFVEVTIGDISDHALTKWKITVKKLVAEGEKDFDKRLGAGSIHEALVDAIHQKHGDEIGALARKSIKQIAASLKQEEQSG